MAGAALRVFQGTARWPAAPMNAAVPLPGGDADREALWGFPDGWPERVFVTGSSPDIPHRPRMFQDIPGHLGDEGG